MSVVEHVKFSKLKQCILHCLDGPKFHQFDTTQIEGRTGSTPLWEV